ncbi:hypothetical protein BC827DRAFT_1238799 [Russula dissimulans]|nr:hypothetical protein BC827DRAFT_1238799 [Russula dissimulans]
MAAFLLLLPRRAARHAPALNGRLKEGSRYTWYVPEVANGHRQTDGRKIRWEITPPVLWVEKEGWTRLPFFCGDVKPRELRVPTHPPSSTEHPNGMLGIVHLGVLTLPLVFPAVTTELTAMIGEEPIDISPSEHVWLLDLPGQVAPSDPYACLMSTMRRKCGSCRDTVWDCSKLTCASTKTTGRRDGQTIPL